MPDPDLLVELYYASLNEDERILSFRAIREIERLQEMIETYVSLFFEYDRPMTLIDQHDYGFRFWNARRDLFLEGKRLEALRMERQKNEF